MQETWVKILALSLTKCLILKEIHLAVLCLSFFLLILWESAKTSLRLWFSSKKYKMNFWSPSCPIQKLFPKYCYYNYKTKYIFKIHTIKPSPHPSTQIKCSSPVTVFKLHILIKHPLNFSHKNVTIYVSKIITKNFLFKV